MKNWSFVALCWIFPLIATEPVRLPEEFTVVERLFSLVSTFDINSDLGTFAVARKRFFSFTPAFDLEDAHEQLLASAQGRFFAWGTVADVVGWDGQKIGWIEEEVVRIIPWAEYRIFNHENRLAAIARMNFFGTCFELYDPDHPEEIYATISRPFIRFFRDYWTVQIFKTRIFEENVIDPRLLVLLAVYQTDKDARDRLRFEIQEELRREFDDFEGTRFGS